MVRCNRTTFSQWWTNHGMRISAARRGKTKSHVVILGKDPPRRRLRARLGGRSTEYHGVGTDGQLNSEAGAIAFGNVVSSRSATKIATKCRRERDMGVRTFLESRWNQEHLARCRR